MLTWAVCWLHTKVDGHNGLWIIAAIIGDAYMAWAIGSGIAGRAL